ncbi:MAG: DUF1553 domain-containing protein, partial [Planctomycetia bacterium]|nr:DUF1553 domain-containing protein [Planctomycetia bacterium]
GLVKTTENMGNQAAYPSHPELLDWLAAEFMESGWDMKQFIKLLVSSRVYRQAATVSAGSRPAGPNQSVRSAAYVPQASSPMPPAANRTMASGRLSVGVNQKASQVRASEAEAPSAGVSAG